MKALLIILAALWLALAAHAADKVDLTILFHENTADLPVGTRAALNQLLAKRAKSSVANGQITITAFAALPDKPAWAAQRLALKRALVVRDYLLKKSVPPKRIILKPIGNLCAVPCQRVDIFLTKY